MIRDGLMTTGSFNIPLREDTPREIRTALGKWDTVCFTPGQIGGTRGGAQQMTIAEMQDVSMFTGVVLGRRRGRAPGAQTPGRPASISGASIVSWLGDASGKGPFTFYIAGTTTTTLGIRLIALDAGGGFPGSYTNGIRLGTTTSVSANNIADAPVWFETPRSMVDRWCRMTTARTEWRVTPDGTWNFRPAGTYDIYLGDPVNGQPVVIGEDLTEEIRSNMVVVPATSLDVEEDFSEYASAVRVSKSGSTDYATTGPLEFNFNNTDYAWMDAVVRADTSASATDMTNLGDSSAEDNYVDRYTYRLTVDPDFLLARWLGPGARFYLYDPDAGQVDASNAVIVGGQQISPATVRLTGMSYPITPQMGVYGWATYRVGSSLATVLATPPVMTDLTPWIDYAAEPKATTLDVGARPIGLTRAIRQGITV